MAKKNNKNKEEMRKRVKLANTRRDSLEGLSIPNDQRPRPATPSASGTKKRNQKNKSPKSLDIQWRYPIMFFILMTVGAYYFISPEMVHVVVMKVADNVPIFVKDWMYSFHDKKAHTTTSKPQEREQVQQKPDEAIKAKPDETIKAKPDETIKAIPDKKDKPKPKVDEPKKETKAWSWIDGPKPDPTLKSFTLDDIKFVEGGNLYLVLMGHVFDVTGASHYQPGASYHGFVGRDASRSFVTGDFSKGVTDDLEDLQASDYLGLSNWLEFYLTHETYKFVGYLNGKYFDSDMKERKAIRRVKSLLVWAGEESEKEGDLLKLFPSCNVEWKADIGSTLWCSSKSGGVDRDWVGYPRKFFEKPDKSPRCACVHPNYLADPRIKQYSECASDSFTCKLLETDK